MPVRCRRHAHRARSVLYCPLRTSLMSIAVCSHAQSASRTSEASWRGAESPSAMTPSMRSVAAEKTSSWRDRDTALWRCSVVPLERTRVEGTMGLTSCESGTGGAVCCARALVAAFLRTGSGQPRESTAAASRLDLLVEPLHQLRPLLDELSQCVCNVHLRLRRQRHRSARDEAHVDRPTLTT